MRVRQACLLALAQCALAANAPTFTHTLSAAIGAIAVDSAGNTYITGALNGATIDPTPGAFQAEDQSAGICGVTPVPMPCVGSYIEKLDPYGHVILATYFGGNGDTAINSIAVDGDGNIYVAGNTKGPVNATNTFPVTAGAAFADLTKGGGFVSKLDASGSRLIYSTLFPAGINAMTVDADGNAYVTGSGGQVPVTGGAFQTSPRGTLPAYAAKLDAFGSAVVYATYVSGGGQPPASGDNPTSVAVDSHGNAFIAGWTYSTDFPVTPGAFRTSNPGQRAIFLIKLNPRGSGLIFSTYLGETNGYPVSVRVDRQGTAFIAGTTASHDFPITSGGLPFNGGGDMQGISGFLTRFSADGSSLIYSTYVGSVSYYPAALDVDPAGNAVVAGAASLANLPIGAAAFQPGYGGGASDVYVSRFSPAGELSGSTYLGGSEDDSAELIALGPNGSVAVAGITRSLDFPGRPVAAVSQTSFVTSIFPSLTILNAASYVATEIAPGEIVALRGYGMGPVVGVAANGAALPFELSGASLLVGAFKAPLLYVQAEQINAQVPWEVSGQVSAIVQPAFPGKPPQTATRVLVSPSLPGVFFVNNADGTANSPSNPARPGDFISIYGTGGGDATPQGSTGQIWDLSSPLSTLTLPVSVSVQNEDARVLYAGSAPSLQSGFFQVNAVLPSDLAGLPDALLTVKIGRSSSTAVPIAIGIR